MTINLCMKQNPPWEADSQPCVQEMKPVILTLKIVTAFISFHYKWVNNKFSETGLHHGFTKLVVTQTIRKSDKYQQLSWILCLWVNILINVMNYELYQLTHCYYSVCSYITILCSDMFLSLLGSSSWIHLKVKITPTVLQASWSTIKTRICKWTAQNCFIHIL
jgi:hypothetical protein